MKPKCPNHNEILEGVPSPLPRNGSGICPISGAMFEFQANTDEETGKAKYKIKNGSLVQEPEFIIKGND